MLLRTALVSIYLTVMISMPLLAMHCADPSQMTSVMAMSTTEMATGSLATMDDPPMQHGSPICPDMSAGEMSANCLASCQGSITSVVIQSHITRSLLSPLAAQLTLIKPQTLSAHNLSLFRPPIS